MKKRKKVLVCMSGGVDSSVAALLLKREGYDVTGAYMINYVENPKPEARSPKQSDCWRDEYRDAVRVAASLDISLIRLDFVKEYKEKVLDYMFAEYQAGRTPNPDVLCNREIKFGVWLERAREMGFNFLATGHYAEITRHETPIRLSLRASCNTRQEISNFQFPISNFQLLISKDTEKDQTYFLHQLNQEQLSHTLFPLGEYTKDEVRAIARKADLPTAEKEESMGICFVGEVPMKEFLKNKIETKIGEIICSDGTVVGEHDGLAYYTIGQRHGFALSLQGVSATKSGTRRRNPDGIADSNEIATSFLQTPRNDSRPLFVVQKRLDTNELVVGYEDDPLLYKKEIQVTEVHWIAGLPPEFPLQCEVRLRHRQAMQNAECRMQNDELKLVFQELQRAATSGQFAVFYKDGVCLGGAIIL